MVHKAWIDVSECDHSEVREELERILASAPFSNSRRYPALLRYVVEKSLSGKAGELKERTVGIEVFHRPPDYDTAIDPVVRFSASEVRRRIAQYYQEEGHRKTIEIGLPSGAYVPHFSRVEPRVQEAATRYDGVSVPSGESEALEQEQFHSNSSTTFPTDGIRARPNFIGTSFLSGLLGGVLVAAVIALLGNSLLPEFSWHRAKTPVMEVWGPLLTHPGTVFIDVGRTQITDNTPPETPGMTIEEHILRPEARITISSVQAISDVAGLMQLQRKQFRIHEAYSTNLQDLHRLPVVLVGAFNNNWTERLLMPLRFHFEQVGALRSIVDASHPDRHDWSIDFNTPYIQQTADYAIVARFNDATTDGPVVVIAGIGSNGTQAAGEFIVSPDALAALVRAAPHGSLNQNFEAVLKIEVIAGNTGAATVVASQFW